MVPFITFHNYSPAFGKAFDQSQGSHQSHKMSDLESDLLIEENHPLHFQQARQHFQGLFDEGNYPRHFFRFLAAANVLVVGIISFWYIGNGMSLAPKSSNGSGTQIAAQIYTTVVLAITINLIDYKNEDFENIELKDVDFNKHLQVKENEGNGADQVDSRSCKAYEVASRVGKEPHPGTFKMDNRNRHLIIVGEPAMGGFLHGDDDDDRVLATHSNGTENR
ncbi:hypothetical protein BDZ45DRAFT_747292 [Acephala macrosclerotiorum]|nr:hypothetical protein BDZ45DRAFT_747292 [Acephala macrosclerotiorum]